MLDDLYHQFMIQLPDIFYPKSPQLMVTELFIRLSADAKKGSRKAELA